jgi:magnesium transporter
MFSGMLSFIRKRSRKAGLPPGILVHIGQKKTEKRIRLVDHSEESLEDKEGQRPEEDFPH